MIGYVLQSFFLLAFPQEALPFAWPPLQIVICYKQLSFLFFKFK